MSGGNRIGLSAAIFAAFAASAKADIVYPPIVESLGLAPGTSTTVFNSALPKQGTPLELKVTIPATENLTVFTTSYSTGGFEPNLSIFGPSGNFITGEQFPGGPYAVDDPSTALALDGYFTAPALPAGTYTIALTDFELQQSPAATNLSDGFTFNIGDGTHFTDEQGNARTGNYSLAIATSPVPEPASLGILITTLGLMVARRRQRMAV